VADKLNGILDFEPAKQNYDDSPSDQFTVNYLRRTDNKKCNQSAMKKDKEPETLDI
jgi:hypothetical protein